MHDFLYSACFDPLVQNFHQRVAPARALVNLILANVGGVLLDTKAPPADHHFPHVQIARDLQMLAAFAVALRETAGAALGMTPTEAQPGNNTNNYPDEIGFTMHVRGDGVHRHSLSTPCSSRCYHPDKQPKGG